MILVLIESHLQTLGGGVQFLINVFRQASRIFPEGSKKSTVTVNGLTALFTQKVPGRMFPDGTNPPFGIKQNPSGKFCTVQRGFGVIWLKFPELVLKHIFEKQPVFESNAEKLKQQLLPGPKLSNWTFFKESQQVLGTGIPGHSTKNSKEQESFPCGVV